MCDNAPYCFDEVSLSVRYWLPLGWITIVYFMGRPLRKLQPGYCYHITVRCNNREFRLNRVDCKDTLLYAIGGFWILDFGFWILGLGWGILGLG
ncbi:MAG: hypothetical protein VKJ64_20280 [Leptolyngbyaceae bacterium]|nr:hypothetical protein [Leptolyngbyaceae bacterium]